MIDVLGRELATARAALDAAGYRVEVVETRSPRPVHPTGPQRVVRQRELADGVVQLLVTHERYAPLPKVPGE